METMSAAEYRAYVGGMGAQVASVAKRESPEEDLQRMCVEYAEAMSARRPLLKYLFHPANGGKRPRGEAGKLKALGVKPGVPDLLLPFPSPNKQWAGMALELKASNGRVTEDQNRWLSAYADNGWLTGLVWEFQDFTDYLEIFFGETRHRARPTFL